MGLLFHELADAFPLIEGERFDELVADIAARGLLERIVLFEGKILDGRNRYRACLAAGSEPEFIQFDGEDPRAYVISRNMHRRDMTPGQRQIAGALLAGWSRGRPSGDIPPDGGISAADAARQLGTSERSIERARVVVESGAPELILAVKQGEVPVSTAEEIARLTREQQDELLAEAKDSDDPGKALSRKARELKNKPRDSRAVMASRTEPDDSLDFFPTPPWATRALVEHVLPELILAPTGTVVREPACGEGHISGVLTECEHLVVFATDVFDYSADGRSAPGWIGVVDFLDERQEFPDTDWIVTNPPFSDDKAEKFILRALAVARKGVAMFVRVGLTEGVGRYEAIFKLAPPTIVAIFAERVPLHKGRWDPDGDTATQYIWLVWIKGEQPRPVFWIPPGQRKALSKPDDVARFTARPVYGSKQGPEPEPVPPAPSDVFVATSAYQARMMKVDGAALQFRQTPEGQPNVPDLVRPGAIVHTNYNTGPYIVVRVSGPHRYAPDLAPFSRDLRADAEVPDGTRVFEHYSLCLVHEQEFIESPILKRLKEDSWVNEVVAVDGRLLKLFEANCDEVFMDGRNAHAAMLLGEPTALGGPGLGQLKPASDPVEHYRRELGLVADRRGNLHQGEAEAVMRAAYSAQIPIAELAQALGHPKGTIKTWANRLRLTSAERLQATQDAFVEHYAEGKPS